jgi:hypothetical protein
MLQLFGFDRIGIVLGDIYWVDPDPAHDYGAERGVRLEIRMLVPGELAGSIYSSRPITIAEPVWRLDLLESVDGSPGSLDRAHYHPEIFNWEPLDRVLDQDLSSDPVGWLGGRLADLEGLLAEAGIHVDAGLANDADKLRACVPEVQRAVNRMLDQVKAGELGNAPDDEMAGARPNWL